MSHVEPSLDPSKLHPFFCQLAEDGHAENVVKGSFHCAPLSVSNVWDLRICRKSRVPETWVPNPVVSRLTKLVRLLSVLRFRKCLQDGLFQSVIFILQQLTTAMPPEWLHCLNFQWTETLSRIPTQIRVTCSNETHHDSLRNCFEVREMSLTSEKSRSVKYGS